MDELQWIATEINPRPVSSAELLYDHMESQSLHGLPIIHKAFDANKRGHWHDRGAILDFLEAVGQGELLDFGPGDGWPSLPVAPFVTSVVGVDASRRRVKVCAENAQRLGIANVRFLHVPPGRPLPFPDASFDGIMAASSVEQTPDPVATLQEFWRVLRPGGRLRIVYEPLDGYRGGKERELMVLESNVETTQLVIYDRRIGEELVVHYGLRFNAPLSQVAAAFGAAGDTLSFGDLSVSGLEKLRPVLADAVQCTLFHPGCRSLIGLLKKAGFREAVPTHWGARLAAELFDEMCPDQRPHDISSVTSFLRPFVRLAVRMEAPEYLNPPITAVK